jgi:hypothetical protein
MNNLVDLVIDGFEIILKLVLKETCRDIMNWILLDSIRVQK